MKLLTVTTYDKNRPQTGATRRFFKLLNYLANRHEVILISPSKPDNENIMHYPVACPQIQSQLIPNTLLFWANMQFKLRLFKNDLGAFSPDVVFAFDETNALPALQLGRRLGVATVLFSRCDRLGYVSTDLNNEGLHVLGRMRLSSGFIMKAWLWFYYRFLVFVYNRTDWIVVQSNYHKEILLRHFPSIAPNKISVISNNIPEVGSEVQVNSDVFEASGKMSIIYVGTLSTRKGVRDLIKAMGIIKRKGFRFQLILVGDGPDREHISTAINQEGIDDETSFLGYVPSAIPYIAQADLLVVPSRIDAFPNVVLEALAVGTPVVATRVGAVPEILGDLEDCLVIPGDVGELAEKITHAYDPAVHKRIRQHVLKQRDRYRFNWCKLVEQWLEKCCPQ